MRHREALLSYTPAIVAARAASRKIASLVQRRCILCTPDTTIAEAARKMVSADVSCAVIRLPQGHGIVTDHDLRARVIAADHSTDAPVAEVMSAPALAADPECPASDVALMMLERGVRHMPVIDARGEVIGVVRDVDLLHAETRTPFTLRREVAAAATAEQIRAIASRLPQMLVGLHDAGTSATQISRVHAAMADAIIQRLLELIPSTHGRPELAPMWIALGSHGRRELAPGSDLDSAATWPSHTTAADEALLRTIAQEMVEATGATAGLTADPHGATAANRIFARSLESWRSAVRAWAADPFTDKVPVVLSALLDGRGVGDGPAWSETVLAEMLNPEARDQLERWLLRLALGHRLPTGFLRSRVLHPTGARKDVDLKRDGLQPIVDIARYSGFVASAGVVSTPGRLKAALDHDVMRGADAMLLIEAHELFSDLRVAHHAEQMRAGEPVTDTIDPEQLNTLSRNYLKDAFRLVAGIQRRMTEQLRQP
jgi:CBS domain-containing protein